MPFNRTPEGRIDQRRFGGHTRDHGKAPVRRACYAADRTGHMILQTLYQNCVKHDVEFFNEFYALDLVLSDTPGGPVATGIVAYELATGDIHVFHAKAIVFATGGSGRMYKTTSNAHTLTGDGLGIVFRKGLPLEDMEFHQFHPTGLAGLGILISEAVRGEGGRLLNADGERFMERYAPTIVDLAPRDIVARSMVLEVLEGRGAGPNKDYVYIDVRHLGADVLEAKLPDITEFARTYLGVDPVTELVPVYPTCHYVMGGIPTTVHGQVLRDNTSIVPGLYAAGECACVSVHGSNRLGTNSLLDINVFGRRAGIAAANYAMGHDFVDMPADPGGAWSTGWVGDILSEHGNERVADIRGALQQSMDNNAAVFRTEETLKQALTDIHAAQGAVRPNHRARQGQALQQRSARGHRARLPARAGRGHRRRCAQPQGVPRRPRPRGLSAPRRHQLHAPHHGVQAGWRSAERHPAGLQARRPDPVRADGTEVLMTATGRQARHERPAAAGPRRREMVTLKIARFNPEDPDARRLAELPRAVPAVGPAAQPAALRQVVPRRDADVPPVVRARRVRQSDAMRINGVNRLACKVLMRDLLPKKSGKQLTITIEPIRGLPVEKDLVVDMEPFFDAFRAVKPFLITSGNPPTRERIQSQTDRARYDDTTKCILCACCTTSCPVFWNEGSYFGPAAIVNAHRFIFDSRDEAAAERLDILNEVDGVWRCRTTFNCTESCPRGIQVTKAIQEVKRALMFAR